MFNPLQKTSILIPYPIVGVFTVHAKMGGADVRQTRSCKTWKHCEGDLSILTPTNIDH